MSTRFLVCSPIHDRYIAKHEREQKRAVGYATPQARREWERFVEMLTCAGDAALVEMDANRDTAELVFTANAALVCGNLAIVSGLPHSKRQAYFRAALSRTGLATTSLIETYFEGASDVMFDRVRPICYGGYGWATERAAILKLQEFVDCLVVPLRLVDERFFHLDMALCPLASGHVVAYMDAFTPHAQGLLRRAVAPRYLIELRTEDALALACNAVEIDDVLILHAASRSFREQLQQAGYRVFSTELGEFARSGASAKRMALRLDDGPVATIEDRPTLLTHA